MRWLIDELLACTEVLYICHMYVCMCGVKCGGCKVGCEIKSTSGFASAL